MKTALVTGATGGIGRALSERFVEQGYHVIGVARREDKLRELSRALKSFDYIAADLSDSGAPAKIRETLAGMGITKLDLLINNAGYAIRKPLLEHSSEELENIFRVNVFAPIWLTKELLPFLRKGSKVVFVISGVAFVNVPEIPSYCATKGALHYLTVNLERELAELGIVTIRVYPKQVKSEFWKGKIPKGSIEPERVADAVLNSIKKNKREVFVPGYLKFVKYLPNWPVFTYRFRY